jgi:enterochelin esterase family protein
MKATQAMAAAFEDDVTQVLIPCVDSKFRSVRGRDRRALAGLSMGGMLTFQVTFDHLDPFSHIGGFSGAAGGLALGNEKLVAKTAFNGACRSRGFRQESAPAVDWRRHRGACHDA